MEKELLEFFFQIVRKENKITASLPYNFNLMSKTIDLLSSNLIDIESELDYINLTNIFYNENWKSSDGAEKRFNRIWNILNYIYRAKISDEDMIDLLKTRSGILTIQAY